MSNNLSKVEERIKKLAKIHKEFEDFWKTYVKYRSALFYNYLSYLATIRALAEKDKENNLTLLLPPHPLVKRAIYDYHKELMKASHGYEGWQSVLIVPEAYKMHHFILPPLVESSLVSIDLLRSELFHKALKVLKTVWDSNNLTLDQLNSSISGHLKNNNPSQIAITLQFSGSIDELFVTDSSGNIITLNSGNQTARLDFPGLSEVIVKLDNSKIEYIMNNLGNLKAFTIAAIYSYLDYLGYIELLADYMLNSSDVEKLKKKIEKYIQIVEKFEKEEENLEKKKERMINELANIVAKYIVEVLESAYNKEIEALKKEMEKGIKQLKVFLGHIYNLFFRISAIVSSTNILLFPDDNLSDAEAKSVIAGLDAAMRSLALILEKESSPNINKYPSTQNKYIVLIENLSYLKNAISELESKLKDLKDNLSVDRVKELEEILKKIVGMYEVVIRNDYLRAIFQQWIVVSPSDEQINIQNISDILNYLGTINDYYEKDIKPRLTEIKELNKKKKALEEEKEKVINYIKKQLDREVIANAIREWLGKDIIVREKSLVRLLNNLAETLVSYIETFYFSQLNISEEIKHKFVEGIKSKILITPLAKDLIKLEKEIRKKKEEERNQEKSLLQSMLGKHLKRIESILPTKSPGFKLIKSGLKDIYDNTPLGNFVKSFKEESSQYSSLFAPLKVGMGASLLISQLGFNATMKTYGYLKKKKLERLKKALDIDQLMETLPIDSYLITIGSIVLYLVVYTEVLYSFLKFSYLTYAKRPNNWVVGIYNTNIYLLVNDKTLEQVFGNIGSFKEMTNRQISPSNWSGSRQRIFKLATAGTLGSGLAALVMGISFSTLPLAIILSWLGYSALGELLKEIRSGRLKEQAIDAILSLSARTPILLITPEMFILNLMESTTIRKKRHFYYIPPNKPHNIEVVSGNLTGSEFYYRFVMGQIDIVTVNGINLALRNVSHKGWIFLRNLERLKEDLILYVFNYLGFGERGRKPKDIKKIERKLVEKEIEELVKLHRLVTNLVVF